jgi:hypothetical protein
MKHNRVLKAGRKRENRILAPRGTSMNWIENGAGDRMNGSSADHECESDVFETTLFG